ncbi:MAG: hypothetical protein JW739_05710 [Opitutales bacterium]|nr:hypothetical protein [Opitutales bacterium]
MIPFLAELPSPDKEFVWQAFLTIAVILSSLSNYRDAFGKRKVETQSPLIIDQAEKYTPLSKTEELEKKVDTNHKEIRELILEYDEKRRISVSKVYTETSNSMKANRAEMKEDLKTFSSEVRQDFKHVHDRLNDISNSLASVVGELNITKK